LRESLEGATIAAARIFHEGCSGNSFKELTLKDNFERVVRVFGVVVLLVIRLLLLFCCILIFVIGDVGDFLGGLIDLFCLTFVSRRSMYAIEFVELSLIFRSKESEMVLDTIVVDSIELGQSGVGRDHMSIPQEPPDLSQSHCKRFFAFMSLDFSRIYPIPIFELRVVAQ
jgi:hypothetical protein